MHKNFNPLQPSCFWKNLVFPKFDFRKTLCDPYIKSPARIVMAMVGTSYARNHGDHPPLLAGFCGFVAKVFACKNFCSDLEINKWSFTRYDGRAYDVIVPLAGIFRN
jgi:hypothetical protein